jgi:hypothetical protein
MMGHFYIHLNFQIRATLIFYVIKLMYCNQRTHLLFEDNMFALPVLHHS